MKNSARQIGLPYSDENNRRKPLIENPDDRWDLDEESIGPEHQVHKIGTIDYGQTIENGKVVGESAWEVKEKVSKVITSEGVKDLSDIPVNGVLERFSDISKGDHRSAITANNLEVSTSSYSDGIIDRAGRDMDISAVDTKLKVDKKGEPVQLEVILLEAEQKGHKGDNIVGRLQYAASQNEFGKTTKHPEDLKDELKVRIDFKNRTLQAESMSQKARCFVINGNNISDVTDTRGGENSWEVWDKYELKKGDKVLILSKELLDILDNVWFADVLNFAGNEEFNRGEKLKILIKEATTEDGKFDTKEFHKIINFWNQQNPLKQIEALKSSCMVCLEMP